MKAVTLILLAYLAPTLLADSPHDVHHGYGQSLTPLEQEKYGKILNFAFDVKNTPMGDFLRGAQFPNIEKIQKLSFQSIVDAIKTDEDFAKIAGENFKQYAENVIARKTKSKSSGGPSASQTDGYDGCWLDYAAFVEPITNALYMLARPTLCDILFPGPFCLLPVLDVPEQTDWGLNMIDAMGKIPPGILDGNIHWVGAYQMCMEDFIDVKYNNTLGAEVEERQFSGQYCRLRFGTQDPVVLNISLPLFLGVCVPDTCTTEYVERYISNPLQGNLVLGTILAFLELDVDNVFCGQEVDASEDQGFQAVIGILIGLAVLVVLATLYDGFIRPRWIKSYLKTLPRVPANATPPMTPRSAAAGGYTNTGYVPCVDPQENANNNAKHGPLEAQFSSTSNSPLVEQVKHQIEKENKIGITERFELIFVASSLWTNNSKIFDLNPKDRWDLPVLNGMRVLSYGWYILGLTWVFSIYADVWATINLRSFITSLPRSWHWQPVANFHFAGDTFLLLAGTLCSYYWLIRLQKKGKLTVWQIIYHIAHRYWRMAPSAGITAAVYATMYRYTMYGPLQTEESGDSENCLAGNWLWVLLQVHNIVDTDNMCMEYMIHMHIIFQLHLVALVVLIPLAIPKVRWLSYVMLTAMYLSHLGATVGVSLSIHSQDGLNLLDWLRTYYYAPWTRAGPFIIGLGLGMIIFDMKLKNKSVSLHWIANICAWLMAFALITTPIFVTYDLLRLDRNPWSETEWTVWNTLGRSSFALGLAWIIFACSFGYGGVVTSFLGHDAWRPFSRLVFQATLFIASIIYGHVYGLLQPLHLDTENMMWSVWMGHMMAAMLWGYGFTLLWDRPISIGWQRAFVISSKLEWMKAANHPEDEVHDIEKEYRNYFSPPTKKTPDESIEFKTFAPSELNGGPSGLSNNNNASAVYDNTQKHEVVAETQPTAPPVVVYDNSPSQKFEQQYEVPSAQ